MSEANFLTAANRREELLQHLDSVYTVALALTSGPDAAVQLAETTYAHVFAHPETVPQPEEKATGHGQSAGPEGQSDKEVGERWQQDKRRLLRQVMAIHRAQAAITGDDAARLANRPPAGAGEALLGFRRRLAEQVVNRTLPPVLATLRSEVRLLLLLCYVEGFSCEEAGEVLDLDPAFACRRFEQAKAAVEAALRADVSARERPLLAALPDTWLRDAFQRMVEAEFEPLPPTVRPTIVAATRTPRRHRNDNAAVTASADRPAETGLETSASRFATRFRRVLLAVLTILTVGLAGYIATILLEQEPETNLIVLSAEQASATPLSFEADSPEEAERWVREQLDWRLTLPTIDEAQLIGVSVRTVVPGVEVPVFLYDDNTADASLAIFVYTYALLENHAGQIQLAPDIMEQIKGDHSFDLHDLGAQKVLVWRDRDDIFVAVTAAEAEALRRRIIFPS